MTTNAAVLESRLCEADPESMADLLNLLVTVYSDTKVAVVREYVANAIDAQKAAGVQTPVEVSLPSLLNPVLSVRDHGVGLSRDDIVNVYGKFGTSTKRGDVDMIGAFGIGSKTAYAVASQFQIIGVKDGFATRVLFSRDANGAPSYTLVSHEPTDEPNGVEVRIFADPQDNASWAKAAKEACRVIVGADVMIDGVRVASALGAHSRLCEGLYFLNEDNSWSVGLRALMGNVSYELPGEVEREIRKELTGGLHLGGYGVVLLEVENKDLDIASSREAVRDTPRTRRALREAARRAVAALKADVERATAGATLPGDILVAYGSLPGHRANPSAFDQIASVAGVLPKSKDTAVSLLHKFIRVNRSPLAVVGSSFLCGELMRNPVLVSCPPDKLGRLRRDLPATTLLAGFDSLIVVESDSGSNELFSWGHGGGLPVVSADAIAADAKTVRANRPKAERKAKAEKPARTFYVQKPGGEYAELTAAEIKALGVPVVDDGYIPARLRNHVVVLRGNRREIDVARKDFDVVTRQEAARLVTAAARASVDASVWSDAARMDRDELDRHIVRARQAGLERAERVLVAWRDRVSVVDAGLSAIARDYGLFDKTSPLDRVPALFRSMDFAFEALEVLNMLDPEPLLPDHA